MWLDSNVFSLPSCHENLLIYSQAPLTDRRGSAYSEKVCGTATHTDSNRSNDAFADHELNRRSGGMVRIINVVSASR